MDVSVQTGKVGGMSQFLVLFRHLFLTNIKSFTILRYLDNISVQQNVLDDCFIEFLLQTLNK